MKHFKKLATLLLSIALLCSVSACLPDLSKMSSSASESDNSQTVYEYSLNLESFSIEVGAKRTLRVIAEPENEQMIVEWISVNPEIATVSDAGEVTGVSAGTTTIQATVDEQTLECEVTVNPAPVTYEYSLDKTAEELTVGNTLQLNVITTPTPESAPTIEWSSSANSVATVNNGLVTAVSAGTATISAFVEGKTLTCEITVNSPVKASASISERESADLTNNHETLDTLYWEHYSSAGERSKLFAIKDYVTTNNLELCTNGFGDYKIPLSYNDGVGNLAYHRNTNGVHTPAGQDATIEFTVQIDENVKAIRVYVGVWNATNSVNLLWGNVVVASAESIVASDPSQAKEITFTLEEVDSSVTELKVTVSASNANNGNVSAPAIVILGNDTREMSAVALNYAKTEMPNREGGEARNEIFLTEYGTQDWIYLNKHDVERMNGGNMILVDSLDVEGTNAFDDYKGNFQWSNGTTTAISSGFNDNGQYGSWATIKTKIDADTDHVYFWVGGYSSTYYFEVYDSKGNLLVADLLHEEEGGVTHSYMIDLAVSVEGEETLMLNIYRTGGANCSVSALAVHKAVEYNYSLVNSNVEVQAGTTAEKLQVIATPDRRFSASFVSNNEEIATVNAEGAITGVQEGETTVKVLINGEEVGLVANVKVTPAPIEYVYEISAENVELMPGQSVELSVNINPVPSEAPAIVWSSNYPDIAEVVNGVVTAKADGEATITAEVDGSLLTCLVKVETKITATVTTTAENPAFANLTDNDANLNTVYWEHYAGPNVEKKANAEDIINLVPGGSGFGDFGIPFNWVDGTNVSSKIYNRDGSHSSGNHVIQGDIEVNEQVKAIRVYVGAWKATNNVSLLIDGIVLATAEPFSADGNPTSREITFFVNVKETLTLTLKVEGTNVEGNVSLNAVVVLAGGEKVTSADVEISMQQSAPLAAGERKDFNLTEIGNLDWFYPESNVFDGEPWDPDEKKDADYLKANSFYMNAYNWYGDFGGNNAYFTWTDGTITQNISGLNDGRCGNVATLQTKVDANVKHVYLYVSGWKSTYEIIVLNSKAQVIFEKQLVEAVDNVSFAYELNFAVNCQSEESLTFVLRTKSGFGDNHNCSIVAIALSSTPDFDYAQNASEVELFEEETAELKISVSPAKDLHVEYASQNNEIATVNEYGVITAVGVGSTVITATVDGKTFNCAVTVNARPVDYTYTVTAETNLIPNQTSQIQVGVSPSKEMILTYACTNEAVAEVDSNGLITAKADGTARIDVLDNGFIVGEISITVKTYVTAGEVTIVNGENQTVNISDASEEYDTIYWERYHEHYGAQAEHLINAVDMVSYLNIMGNANIFSDYKANLCWSNGSDVTTWDDNRDGFCYGGQIVLTINVTTEVKQITVYTGAWKASVYAQLLQGSTVIATSDTWEAGNDGIARFVTFNINVIEATTLTLTINPTPIDNGNASITGIAFLGNASKSTTLTVSKNEIANGDQIDLTAVGTLDWNYVGAGEKMADGGNLIYNQKQDGNGHANDYKGSISFTNGTNQTSGTSSQFIHGGYAQITVKVNPSVNNIILYVTAWDAEYCVMAVDSKGVVIANELVHIKMDSTSVAYAVNFAVNATAEDEITFIVYKTHGSNCGLAAVAVS